jgi:3-hydroxyisobutyrate dehydrogenase-like beta-hydroxyacid dehydrogenase
MGSAIAARLIGLGHKVTVWNRTSDKTKTAVRQTERPPP